MSYVFVVLIENDDHEPNLKAFQDDKVALLVAEDMAKECCGDGEYEHDIHANGRHTFTSKDDDYCFQSTVSKLIIR